MVTSTGDILMFRSALSKFISLDLSSDPMSNTSSIDKCILVLKLSFKHFFLLFLSLLEI